MESLRNILSLLALLRYSNIGTILCETGLSEQVALEKIRFAQQCDWINPPENGYFSLTAAGQKFAGLILHKRSLSSYEDGIFYVMPCGVTFDKAALVRKVVLLRFGTH